MTLCHKSQYANETVYIYNLTQCSSSKLSTSENMLSTTFCRQETDLPRHGELQTYLQTSYVVGTKTASPCRLQVSSRAALKTASAIGPRLCVRLIRSSASGCVCFRLCVIASTDVCTSSGVYWSKNPFCKPYSWTTCGKTITIRHTDMQ